MMTTEAIASQALNQERGAVLPGVKLETRDPSEDTQEIPFPPNVIPSENKIERHLSLITPEFQEQLNIEWGALDRWLVFRIHTVLVQRIYCGESLTVDPAELRDAVVIPEYEYQHRVYTDEVADIRSRQLPELRFRTLNAENDVTYLTAYGDSEALKRRTNELYELQSDTKKVEMKARIKESTASAITTLLTSPDETELLARINMLAHTAKKDALRELIQVQHEKIDALDDDLRSESAHDLAIYTHKLQVLQAELAALEALETPPHTEPEYQSVQSNEEPVRNNDVKEQGGMRARFGALAHAALTRRIAFLK